MFAHCCSVLSLIRDGLQQHRDGCDREARFGTTMMRQLTRVRFVEVSQYNVFRERSGGFSPDLCAAEVEPRVQTVEHWLCCGNCDMRHDATLSKAQKKQKQNSSM